MKRVGSETVSVDGDQAERKFEKKIVVVNDGSFLGDSYYQPFQKFAPAGPTSLLETNPEEILCVVFTGGSDVHPSLYGEEVNRRTYANIARDNEDRKYFEIAKKHGIPMVGICRGSQFLCVMNGGRLVQHMDNHGGFHMIKTKDGKTLQVNSTHHQMAWPNEEAIPIAWSAPNRSPHYEGATGVKLTPDREYEAVLYPQTNSLGIQWHPEMLPDDSEGYLFAEELIADLLNKGSAA